MAALVALVARTGAGLDRAFLKASLPPTPPSSPTPGGRTAGRAARRGPPRSHPGVQPVEGGLEERVAAPDEQLLVRSGRPCPAMAPGNQPMSGGELSAATTSQ